MNMTTTILTALIVIVGIILLLVALLLVLRAKLIPQGNVTITINNDKKLTVPTGNSLISTLAEQHIYLPSACGGLLHPQADSGPLAAGLPGEGERRPQDCRAPVHTQHQGV